MPGKVGVKIKAGRNLPVMDRSSDTTDAFVEMKLGRWTHKTDVCRKSLNPQWNSDWFRFEVDDAELQDEPLQIRLMDYDTYSANDAIGKVNISLNPLCLETATGHGKGTVLSGWIPVFDTMHGIRGEVYVIVKVDLFSDVNKFRQSSCGIPFFHSPCIPFGYRAQVIHGFVEELVVNDDPEYQWIDKIRTPRASNEARQVVFLNLSGQVQRKMGLKAINMGANAVIGYAQCFDLEGDVGVVARGIGTAVTLIKDVPIAPATTDNALIEERTKKYLEFMSGNNCGKLHAKQPGIPKLLPNYQLKIQRCHSSTLFEINHGEEELYSDETDFMEALMRQEDDRGERCKPTKTKNLLKEQMRRLTASSRNLLNLFNRLAPDSSNNNSLNDSLEDQSHNTQLTRSLSNSRFSLQSAEHANKTAIERYTKHKQVKSKLGASARPILRRTHGIGALGEAIMPHIVRSISDDSAITMPIKGKADENGEENTRSTPNMLVESDNGPSYSDDGIDEASSSSSCSPDDDNNAEADNEYPLMQVIDEEEHAKILQLLQRCSIDEATDDITEEEENENAFMVAEQNANDENSWIQPGQCDGGDEGMPHLLPRHTFLQEIKSFSHHIQEFMHSPRDIQLELEQQKPQLQQHKTTKANLPSLCRSLSVNMGKKSFYASQPDVMLACDLAGAVAQTSVFAHHLPSICNSSYAMELLPQQPQDMKKISSNSLQQSRSLVNLTDLDLVASASANSVNSRDALCANRNLPFLVAQSNQSTTNAEKSITSNNNKASIVNQPSDNCKQLSNLELVTTKTCTSNQLLDESLENRANKYGECNIKFIIEDFSVPTTVVDLEQNLPSAYPCCLNVKNPNTNSDCINCGNMMVANYDEHLLSPSVNNCHNPTSTYDNMFCNDFINLLVDKNDNKLLNTNTNNHMNSSLMLVPNIASTSNPSTTITTTTTSQPQPQPLSPSISSLLPLTLPHQLHTYQQRHTTHHRSMIELSGTMGSCAANSGLHSSSDSPGMKRFASPASAAVAASAASGSNHNQPMLNSSNNNNNNNNHHYKQYQQQSTAPTTHHENRTKLSPSPSKLAGNHHPSAIHADNSSTTTTTSTATNSNSTGITVLSKDNVIGELCRRSSDSDLSVTPKGNSICVASDRLVAATALMRLSQPIVTNKGSTNEGMDMLEYPFLTIAKYPPGFVLHLGATVTARSVKLLERVPNPDEPEVRDSWWTELRMEIRSHARALGCNVVLGYSESTTISDEVCVLSATGTAAVINMAYNRSISQTEIHSTGKGVASGTGGVMSASLDDREIFSKEARNCGDTNCASNAGISSPLAHTNSIVANLMVSSKKHNATLMAKNACHICHIPYNLSSVPFNVKMKKCAICHKGRVPDVLLATLEVPDYLPVTGRGCFMQAQVVRAKKDLRSELNAKEISDALPFLEYELHRVLINKLKAKGMNAIFGLKAQVSIGERMIALIATGTALFLSALPVPQVPKIVAGNSWTDKQKLNELQKKLQETFERNQEIYQLKCLDPDCGAFDRQASDTDESDDEVIEIDLNCGNKDACVLEVDDIEDLEIISLLMEPYPPEGFHVVNTQSVPGLLDMEAVKNIQMFTQVWRAKLDLAGQNVHGFPKHFQRLLQTIYFKLRSMIPCAICDLRFRLDLPESDQIQLLVTGMALGLNDSNKIKYRRKTYNFTNTTTATTTNDETYEMNGNGGGNNHNHSNNNNNAANKRSIHEEDYIFPLDEDQMVETPTPTSNMPPYGAHSFKMRKSSPSPNFGASTGSSNTNNNCGTKSNTSNRLKNFNLRDRYGVDITPLCFIPGGRIDKYLGNLNFFFIRESTSIRENGGISGFVHGFITELLAVIRAHISSLGGNAMVSFYMTELILVDNQHKNQGQCLISIGGDAVSVSYLTDE